LNGGGICFFSSYTFLNYYVRAEAFRNKHVYALKLSEYLTKSQSILLKNGWWRMSAYPVSEWQPNRSAGFLFKNPLSTEAAFTDNERGIRIVFSRITEET